MPDCDHVGTEGVKHADGVKATEVTRRPSEEQIGRQDMQGHGIKGSPVDQMPSSGPKASKEAGDRKRRAAADASAGL